MMYASLRQRAYMELKDKILRNEIPPGSRIREELLIKELSASRTPIREAINQLAAEGFSS